MMKRINITIDDDLLNNIDIYSNKIHLSRSGFISFALSSYLEYIANIPYSFSYTLKHLTDSEEV